MAMRKSEEIERQALDVGASQMALAARTAPKTRGVDSLRTALLTGPELELLATEMEKKVGGKSTNLPIFKRDADSVRKASAVLLIGVSRDPKRIDLPFNCGACGYKTCAHLVAAGRRQGEDFTGPVCIFQAIDLGIALGSAVKVAAELGIDNRIMYTVGAAAKKLNFLDSDVVMGIPLSVTGKNPFFDRPPV
jgi:uncharacterized ferredoxin-like protein